VGENETTKYVQHYKFQKRIENYSENRPEWKKGNNTGQSF